MGVGIGKLIVTVVIVAELVGGAVTVANVPDPAPPVVETEAPTQAQTEAQSTWHVAVPEAPKADGFVAYRIYGRDIPLEWQRYLYDKLAERGFAWFWPYAVCQIFQESRWNPYSDNGRDRGITQQKAIYWADRAAYWGVPGADIWDVYAQLHVYTCMMCGYLAAFNGDVGWALSVYYLGTEEYSTTYVNAVMDHWGALEAVR